MKQAHHTTLTGTATTPADVCPLGQSLACLHARLAALFGVSGLRERAAHPLLGCPALVSWA